ncbi:MAG: putative bifunctional diguanylate cyclase/phosphodiesterase [Leucothrix sp.]
MFTLSDGVMASEVLATALTHAEQQWLAQHPNIQLVQPDQTLFQRSTTITISLCTLIIVAAIAIWITTLYKAKENIRVSEAKVRQQANFDSLTGLYNRHKFYEILCEEIDQARDNDEVFALLFLDLDEFKEVNDTLGHGVGDALLRRVANRLKNRIRSRDIVARLGGDEFTIIISNVKRIEDLETIASNVCESISSEFMIQGHSIKVSTSIGITCFPHDADTDEEIMINADQAMYASKSSGRNRYTFFDESMRATRIERSQTLQDLRVAIDDDQLELFYQPIIDFQTGRLVKAEALIRWHHPEKGMIFPGAFIELAEESGMIHEIGELSFRAATAKAAEWRKQYDPAFQISLNTSPIQYRESGINVEAWGHYLAEHGIDGSAIIVEITEGLLMESSYAVKEKLLALRDHGIEVAIDDFGTGYSSLSYLRKFDIDYLKIDQSFISTLAPDSEDMALCEAIIVMAHKLDCKVVAEGIETMNQHQLLKGANCDAGQGYLFSKGLPADEFEKLLIKEQYKQTLLLSDKNTLLNEFHLSAPCPEERLEAAEV